MTLRAPGVAQEREAAVGHIERSEPMEVAELLPFDPPE